MSTGIQYDEEWSQRIVQIYSTPDVVAQREAVLSTLDLQQGEYVLDIGSGPGLLAHDIAKAVGQTGMVRGIDISDAMVALSEERCSNLPFVEFQVADATELPFPNDEFNVAVSTQVYEYVKDVSAALNELYRVLRPGGRALILDTDWETLIWNTSDQERMKGILAAFEEHCSHPRLPRILAPKLRDAGFSIQRQDVFPLFNPKYHSDTYSHGVIDFIASFVSGKGDIAPRIIKEWAEDLRDLGKKDEYFFGINRYLFLVGKPVAGKRFKKTQGN